MRDFIDLEGASGTSYRFRRWPPGAPHPPAAGHFAWVRETGGRLQVICLGEAENLARVPDEAPGEVRAPNVHLFTRLNISREARTADHEDLAAKSDR